MAVVGIVKLGIFVLVFFLQCRNIFGSYWNILAHFFHSLDIKKMAVVGIVKIGIFVLVFIVQWRNIFGSDSISDYVETLLDPAVYNKKERPLLNHGEPVEINVDLFVSSISNINEISMDFKINIFLRQRWKDPRLASTNHSIFNSTITLSHNLLSSFWVGDLFMVNERTKGVQHDVTTPNILLQISPDGSVLLSQRVSSSLACHMLLHQYPLDKQDCLLEMESYGYTTADINYIWRDIEKPVQVNSKMQLPEFNLTSVNTEICTAAYTTGAFSCIRATFHLERLFEYYLIQVYVPSVLVIVLSWVSFWIDIHAVPARISVGLLTVLTITTQASGVSSKLPRVSYIKAIDVWMFMSMLFVFGALIEYSIVNVLARTHRDKVEKMQKKIEEEKAMRLKNLAEEKESDNAAGENGIKHNSKPLPEITQTNIESPEVPIEKKMSWFKKIQYNKALMVDVMSRLGFPGAFIVFNIVYWIYYTRPTSAQQ